jgi:hypothetical protein
MTTPRYFEMPTDRVAAVRKMLSSQPGQDLIRLFVAKSLKDWDEVVSQLRSIADSPGADGFNADQDTRSARTNEGVAETLKKIVAEDESLDYLTTEL